MGCMFGLITLVTGFSSDRDDDGLNGTTDVCSMMCVSCQSDEEVQQSPRSRSPEIHVPRKVAQPEVVGQVQSQKAQIWRADGGRGQAGARGRFLRCR